jgi:hypothetical protein
MPQSLDARLYLHPGHRPPFPANCTRDVLLRTVLLKVYAKCLYGQRAIAKRRIEEALGDLGEGGDTEPPGATDGDG